MDSTITLQQYLGKGKTFVIPDYQRGYIWGKRKANPGDPDSVSYILNTLFGKMAAGEPIFLQGVTVTESGDSITLIDGQQRTTFLYILLKLLGYGEKFSIRYAIRDESDRFLANLTPGVDFTDNPAEEFQDIYYFKKSARLILERLESEVTDRRKMTEYLLANVRFLYINIPESQARKVFTMMNGNRARMLEPEIIKAELLRLVSLPGDGQQHSDEWELNMLRSRYAREWDRWIHWWNRPEVRKMYKTDSQLGWLLVALMPEGFTEPENVTFESFCKEIFGKSRSVKTAKDTFYRLRQTQKRFEDTFNNPFRHNMVGAILRISRDKAKFVKYYFTCAPVGDEKLQRYYLCSFLSMTHDKITASADEFSRRFRESFDVTLKALKNPLIYEDNSGGKEAAFRLLLRLNIDEDNRQNNGRGRRFDFTIWDDGLRSLEHIYAKSGVYHQDEEGRWFDGNGKPKEPDAKSLLRKDIGSIEDKFPPLSMKTDEPLPDLTATEHCIGNLVLLYSDDNSTFNAADFAHKKKIFLVGEEKEGRKEFFKSRHLLHTVCHFAESDWGAYEISNYFERALAEFCKTYSPIIDSLSTPTENAQQD